MTVTGDVTWYQSSDRVRRGFCPTCGSFLFFDALFQDWTAISVGAFDGPTGVKLTHHIYIDNKGNYYDIADGLPQTGQ